MDLIKVALYARVSTTNHGQNPETQLIPLREHARQRGMFVIDEYVDLGWSGSKERRPNLDRLMADARKKRFELILVARFDRFARSTKHLLTALAEFQSLGINFASLNEAIDTSTPMGRMVFTIVGAVAELERELIRERVAMGIARARKEGKRLGRPRALVDEVKICELIAAGKSLKSVAKDAGVARGTIRSIVARRGNKAVNEGVKTPLNALA